MALVRSGDVDVCAFADRHGIRRIHVAVAGARLPDQELLASVTQAFQTLAIGSFSVVKVSAIPCNAAGKIPRAQLKDTIVTALGLKRA